MRERTCLFFSPPLHQPHLLLRHRLHITTPHPPQHLLPTPQPKSQAPTSEPSNKPTVTPPTHPSTNPPSSCRPTPPSPKKTLHPNQTPLLRRITQQSAFLAGVAVPPQPHQYMPRTLQHARKRTATYAVVLQWNFPLQHHQNTTTPTHHTRDCCCGGAQPRVGHHHSNRGEGDDTVSLPPRCRSADNVRVDAAASKKKLVLQLQQQMVLLQLQHTRCELRKKAQQKRRCRDGEDGSGVAAPFSSVAFFVFVWFPIFIF